MCGPQTITISGECVPTKDFIPSLIVACLVAIIATVAVCVRRRVRRADALWTIESSEVKFKKPPEVLGKGSFGVVSMFVRVLFLYVYVCKYNT